MSMNIPDTTKIIENFKLFWQYPVITEKTFYEQQKHNFHYFGFPWATVIDKKYNVQVIYKILQPVVAANPQIQYYTCCQHIYFHRLIPLFKALNITTIYACHKTKDVDILDGIQIKPCPLYAVNVEDDSRNREFLDVDYVNCDRKYLYSFSGAYQHIYLSRIRLDIFHLPEKSDVWIENTGGWHFNDTVYGKHQTHDLKEVKSTKQIENTQKYNRLLLDSRFSLCPSGSGPNSIRFWESLAVGAIPVLLADTLELPEHELWKDTIVVLKEKDIGLLDSILRGIDSEKERIMRENCLRIYNDFRTDYRNSQSKRLFTSYLCPMRDNIVTNILHEWSTLNPSYDILYFSDDDIDEFFKTTQYYEVFKLMKNGVAKADFFRVCYIHYKGGYWFDIDLEPVSVNIPKEGKVHLFDCGYGNISYMFIGGEKRQPLFEAVIMNVVENIKRNHPDKKQHIMEITGPRVIQNIVFERLNIVNKDGCFPATLEPTFHLQNTVYEFIYTMINMQNRKSNAYHDLQRRYKKQGYFVYNFV